MTDEEEVAHSFVQRDAVTYHAARKGIAVIEEDLSIGVARAWIQSGMMALDSANEHDLGLLRGLPFPNHCLTDALSDLWKLVVGAHVQLSFGESITVDDELARGLITSPHVRLDAF